MPGAERLNSFLKICIGPGTSLHNSCAFPDAYGLVIAVILLAGSGTPVRMALIRLWRIDVIEVVRSKSTPRRAEVWLWMGERGRVAARGDEVNV